MEQWKLTEPDSYRKPFEFKATNQLIRAGDQMYVSDEIRKVRRKDGKEATIVALSSTCHDCGDPFTFTLPARGEVFQPNRRCKKHHKPGRSTGTPDGPTREVKVLRHRLKTEKGKTAIEKAKWLCAVGEMQTLKKTIKTLEKEKAEAVARAEHAEKRLGGYELTPTQEKRLTQAQRAVRKARIAAERDKVRRAKMFLRKHETPPAFG